MIMKLLNNLKWLTITVLIYGGLAAFLLFLLALATHPLGTQ